MTSCPPWILPLLLLVSSGFAGDEDHWSFQPIQIPVVPEGSAVTPGRSPIDAFIDEKLAGQNLKRSPEAPPHTLLRRLHLDLTGLLPAPDEVTRFVEAFQSNPDQAYAAKVDELLASPHFGEHWGKFWLDLARYGDSDGYLGDTLRPWAWVYRDWVIDAINRDQPFDQFSIEQLAGDLLPNATQEQKIAAGFHRNQLKNTEAGADRELDRTKQVVDRVATTGVTWLGLTLACAECHDHKHDPISQKEFFELYAFFNNTEASDISIRIDREWSAYEKKQAAWEAELKQLLSGLPERPKPSGKTAPVGNWIPVLPDKTEAAGTDLTIQDDGSILASGKTPSTVSYFIEAPVATDQTITGFRLDTIGSFGDGRGKGKTAGRGKNGEFILSMFFPDLIIDGKAKRIVVVSAQADQQDGGDIAEVLKPSTDGWKISTSPYQNHSLVFSLSEPLTLPAGSRLKFSLGHKSGVGNSIQHLRIYTTTDPEPALPQKVNVDPSWAKLRLPIEKHLTHPPTPPSTKAQSFVELEESKRRESFLHVRGDYTRKGDAVSPRTPAILHSMPEKEKRTRLELAHWLFDPGNPLTARVTVNRIWSHLFGEGIVATPDDFGTYGSRPSHPELLDWLAIDFQENGWSRKEMIRRIVLSSTYRQSSDNTSPELPNALLWRQNSFRIPAETIRDIHLAASGLLTPTLGGPAVHPPLPEFVTAVGRSVKWPESTGPDRYRRGIYIFLKRTVLYPMLTAFDAPDTSSACAKRDRTNTPMQALTLLNDPVFFECAETLGKELAANHSNGIEEATQDLYLRCLNREPTPAEVATLRSAHHDLSQFAKSPELAMTALARIVMNLDEFITRD
ncbi:MAG: DUF1549 and DUF1553 domain-containing protein [Verrucomicrobiales bacterium]|nr:DUF1549 and DUF1553 domain-containing protein [Verrucomicrobiales bacterium]